MFPSLVATDLDGTFLGGDRQASAENVAAMLHACSLGIPVVVATGRPARWLDVLDPIRPAHPYVIASNGAVIYDLAAGEMVERAVMDKALTLTVAHEMREVCPEIAFAIEFGIGYARETRYPVRGDFMEADHVAELDEIIATNDFVKLLVLSEDRTGDELAHALLPVCHERLTATWSMGGPMGLLEISSLGVTKASALRRLAQDLGVDLADAVAFGDMPNDLEMLHAVGHPYAMADCHPLLSAAGFPSAGGHHESGVGRTVESLLKA